MIIYIYICVCVCVFTILSSLSRTDIREFPSALSPSIHIIQKDLPGAGLQNCILFPHRASLYWSASTVTSIR